MRTTVSACDECGTDILEDDAMCSEITEEYYCCKECMEKAEDEFKRKELVLLRI